MTGWIPIADRLPAKSGHYPIVHSHKTFGGQIVRKQWYAYYDVDDGLWHDQWDYADTRWSRVVSHWLELPPKPEVGHDQAAT